MTASLAAALGASLDAQSVMEASVADAAELQIEMVELGGGAAGDGDVAAGWPGTGCIAKVGWSGCILYCLVIVV